MEDTKILKTALCSFCEHYVRNRISRIRKNMDQLLESLNSETKSSAGDKHETGRAMVQLEREKLGEQLLEAEKTERVLRGVNIDKNSSVARLGSLVNTTAECYFLAVSAGEFKGDGKRVYCISLQSPIGQHLLGKSPGDTFKLNDSTIEVTEVI